MVPHGRIGLLYCLHSLKKSFLLKVPCVLDTKVHVRCNRAIFQNYGMKKKLFIGLCFGNLMNTWHVLTEIQFSCFIF